MLPTESNGNEQEHGKTMTRRQLLASLGAAGVLLATGTGFPGEAQAAAVLTPTLDKGVFYNVKDFGAQGEGRFSQDDTPYIQAAINAASSAVGGTVYIPPGDYVLRSSLQLRSKVHLLGAGPGVTVLRSGDTAVQLIRCLSNVSLSSVEGITFEGTGVGTGSTANPMVECGVYIFESEQIRISRCTFNRLTTGVQLIRSQHIALNNCTFSFMIGSDSPYEGFGVVIEGGSNHTVQSNRFKNVFKNGIMISAGSSYSLIADNIFEACKDAAIVLTSKLTACSYHVIRGNLISAAKIGEEETSCTYGVRLKDYCSFNTISNNAISSPAFAGIQLEASDNAGDDRPYGNTITGNMVNKSVKGIVVLNGSANSVKSNEVRRVETGIVLDTIGESAGSIAKQNVITANSLYQCSVSAVKIGSARCQGNQVFGNGGFDNTAGLTDSGTDTVTAGF
ncbi:glycosyl hydrolase family 28-related protein [Paenibacillus piri]|uniref:Pectate lyase superfamily protein domain-containing protein n=1 Tax=Paenibacillus piri TaxID=2547395 RepID=A0A4R5KS82_9BACL|nr:glycosyl hydrolase family 28-related protein [Paenibacillus piri]TDF98292.1 hypothetical protein E1757_12445 [Paenibacillus piri]